jgi:hypothetical protein
MKFVFLLRKSLISLSILSCLYGISLADAAPMPIDDSPPPKNASVDQYLQALKAMNEKRHIDARNLLEKLVDSEPQHAGALLDLAIMQCSLGNKPEAERLFGLMITRFSPPPAILEIINLHRASGCVQKTPEMTVNFSLEKGYDTNANQGASNSIFTFGDINNPVSLQLLPEYLPKPDHYSSAILDLSKDISDNKTIYFQLRGKHYDVLSNFNSIGLAAGIEDQFSIKDWSIHPSASVNFLTLNQTLYQKQATGRLKFDIPAQPGAAVKFNVIAALSRLLYPSVKNYNGTNLDLRFIATRQATNYFANFSAALTQDVGNDQRLGGDRKGWSLGAFLRNGVPFTMLARQPYTEFGWQHQRWQSEKAYLSGLIDTKKYQKNTIYRAALGFPIDQESSIQLEYRRIINHETISFLSFDSRQVQLSWQWQK